MLQCSTRPVWLCSFANLGKISTKYWIITVKRHYRYYLFSFNPRGNSFRNRIKLVGAVKSAGHSEGEIERGCTVCTVKNSRSKSRRKADQLPLCYVEVSWQAGDGHEVQSKCTLFMSPQLFHMAQVKVQSSSDPLMPINLQLKLWGIPYPNLFFIFNHEFVFAILPFLDPR